ncbi:MAG: isoprenyl transferase [Planctomycetes bacterium]|jgi:undecaprenyl diphosphate synthase|nr:isoprenyl transferase [Planctomycetota bacterium]
MARPSPPEPLPVLREKLPRHVAIIMDGNGRWARKKGMRRVFGHRAGSETVRRITTECARLGLDRLTLYAFSSENWKRPKTEIAFLMRLLREFLVKERKTLMKNLIRFGAIGRLAELPEAVRTELAKTTELTAGNGGLRMTLALAYGGRAEIADAARRIAEEARDGRLDPAAVDEEAVRRRLYDTEFTDPDLLIRTGGEMRVSNFLLWQIAYSELYVTPVFWPDFTVEHLHEALREFALRERRYGGIPEAK